MRMAVWRKSCRRRSLFWSAPSFLQLSHLKSCYPAFRPTQSCKSLRDRTWANQWSKRLNPCRGVQAVRLGRAHAPRHLREVRRVRKVARVRAVGAAARRALWVARVNSARRSSPKRQRQSQHRSRNRSPSRAPSRRSLAAVLVAAPESAARPPTTSQTVAAAVVVRQLHFLRGTGRDQTGNLITPFYSRNKMQYCRNWVLYCAIDWIDNRVLYKCTSNVIFDFIFILRMLTSSSSSEPEVVEDGDAAREQALTTGKRKGEFYVYNPNYRCVLFPNHTALCKSSCTLTLMCTCSVFTSICCTNS